MSILGTERRQFIRASLLAALTLPFLGLLPRAFAGKKGDSALPAGTNAVSESDAVASALGYKASVVNIDFTKYPQRKKPEAKTQFCDNCALYTPSNTGWGKCQMLTSGVVNSKGWCGSWSKKA